MDYEGLLVMFVTNDERGCVLSSTGRWLVELEFGKCGVVPGGLAQIEASSSSVGSCGWLGQP